MLPNGCKLLTLRDAALYITKLPKAEHDAPEWQTAMGCPDSEQAAESFVGCDTFDQRHKLALHSLVFHRRIGPKQSQGKAAVEKQ